MSNDPILSLLGLALRGNHLAVGEEPVESAARAKDARVLLLAADAADNTRRRIERFADAGQCLWIRVPFTKEQLGQAVGRSSVAVTAVTDIGLAAALVRRLADRDPARYGESARRLDVKSQRAAERKAEMLAHEKNLRSGRSKPKAPKAPAPEQAPEPEQKPAPRKSEFSTRRPAPRREDFDGRKPAPRKDGPDARKSAPYKGGFSGRRPAPREDGPDARKSAPYKGGFSGRRPAPREDGPDARKSPPYKGGFSGRRPASQKDGYPPRKPAFSKDGPPEGNAPGQKPPFRKDGSHQDTRPFAAGTSPYRGKSRPSKENRPKPRAKTSSFLNSRPVKKGKGSFHKKDS